MSQIIECDRCKKKMYTDCRSHKGDWSTVNIDWIDGYSTIHLCKDCHKLFLIEFMKLYTSEEFDDEFGNFYDEFGNLADGGAE